MITNLEYEQPAIPELQPTFSVPNKFLTVDFKPLKRPLNYDKFLRTN